MDTREKILVVEDYPGDQKMISMALEKENYEVITAMDGKEGIAKARNEKPDLIIMDVILPEEDGLEACKKLKADPRYAHIPIVIHTSIQDSPIILREIQKVTNSP
ncbi:MAG: response regulator, partial [Theionarchaea archaeon]|nr:response regulator [Theionarchaea archaeon]